MSPALGVGTTPDRHVLPPSVVTTYVLPVPTAQTVFSSTGLTAISKAVVLLFCGVSVGPVGAGFCAIRDEQATMTSRKQAGKRFDMIILSETIEGLNAAEYRTRISAVSN